MRVGTRGEMEPEARRDVQLAACDDAISRRMTHGSRFRSRLPAIGFGSGLKRANLHARLSPPRSACVWINVGKKDVALTIRIALPALLGRSFALLRRHMVALGTRLALSFRHRVRLLS